VKRYKVEFKHGMGVVHGVLLDAKDLVDLLSRVSRLFLVHYPTAYELKVTEVT